MTTFARYPSLADRAVLITGGATGIGAELVAQFVAQGAKVGFIDIDVPAAQALVARLADARHAPHFVAADITDTPALNAAVDALRAQCGPFRALLNNAANDVRHRIEDTTPESWDKSVGVNLKHQFFAARCVIEDMKAAGGGAIVNFGSISWMLKQGGMPVYTTSKSAVPGPDAQPGARPGAVQHPRQHAGAGLGDDRQAGAPVGHARSQARDRARPVHQPAGAARAHRPHGAVPGL